MLESRANINGEADSGGVQPEDVIDRRVVSSFARSSLAMLFPPETRNMSAGLIVG